MVAAPLSFNTEGPMICEFQIKRKNRPCKRKPRYRVIVQSDGFNVCTHHCHHFEGRYPVAKLDDGQMPGQRWLPFT